jgi:hypothetical protein
MAKQTQKIVEKNSNNTTTSDYEKDQTGRQKKKNSKYTTT